METLIWGLFMFLEHVRYLQDATLTNDSSSDFQN